MAIAVGHPAEDWLQLWWDGLLTEAECAAKLETMKVRGGFNSEGFCGYDYRDQVWIDWQP